jgi:hypothetical protein
MHHLESYVICLSYTFLLGIYVDCRGSAQVSFTRTEQQMNTIYRNGRSHNEVKNITTHYQSSESYFRHRITINAGGKILM